MDGACVRVKGQRAYLDRAVDRGDQTLDFMLSAKREEDAARRFLKRAISTNGTPDRIALDKSGANLAGLHAANVIQKIPGCVRSIRMMRSEHRNNMVEQNRRFINQITPRAPGSKRSTRQLQSLPGSKLRT